MNNKLIQKLLLLNEQIKSEMNNEPTKVNWDEIIYKTVEAKKITAEIKFQEEKQPKLFF